MRKKAVEIFLLVTSIILFFTACSNHKKEETKDNFKEKEKNYSYESSFQDIKISLDGISDTYFFEQNIYTVGYRNKENKKGTVISKYYLICNNLDGSAVREILLDIKEQEEPYKLMMGKENQLYLLSQFHNFDSDLGITIEDYYIHKIDVKKQTEDSFQLKIKKKTEEDAFFIQDMMITEDTILFNSEEEVYAFDLQGKQKGNYNFGGYTGTMAQTEKGEIYVCGHNGSDYGLRKLDLEKGKFEQFISLIPNNIYRTKNGTYNITLQDGKEDMIYINDSNNMHCYDTKKEEFTTLFNWINYDMDGNNTNQYFPSDKEIFFIINNLSQNEIEVAELKKKEGSFEKEKTVLKFNCIYVTNTIKENILSFNRTHSDVRIELEDYSSYEDPAMQLNLDITAGNVPDILSIDSLPVLQYIRKGILTDLYPLMEQDKEVKKEDFIETVIHTLEHDGKLYYMGSDFSVRPLLGSNQFTKGMESWTVDDMIALYKDLPKNGLFLCNDTYNMSRQLFLKNILSNQLEDYIQMEIGETSLDSEEFIKILKFSKNFPDENDIAEDVFDRFKIGMPIMVQKGKLILSDCFHLLCMPDIQAFRKMYKKIGGFTIMNYPSIKGDDRLSMTIGNNTMAITEKCVNKEAAWEFVRMFLTYDYQKSKGFYDGIPTRIDAFEKMLEYSMTVETFTDADGMFVEPVDIQYIYDDYTVIVGPLNQEEIDIIRSIVERIGKCTYNDTAVKEISNIVIEEAETFFSGDKTAEEAANVMQNRAKIYVSENS